MTISQDSSAPLVAIVGATGNQGGSVLRFLAESDRPYRLRALTRDASKPGAQKLAEQGVEVVSVTLSADNLEGAKRAFDGADIAFGVTNFWEHVDKDREVAEGKTLVDAALAAGVRLYIYSSLPSFDKASNGKYKNVHHFEGKALVDDYARSKVSKSFKYVAVQAGFYDTNMLPGPLVRKAADGKWRMRTLIEPDTILPSIDISEYGLWVRAVIENPEVQDDGRPVCAVSEDISLTALLDTLRKHVKVPIEYEVVSAAEMRAEQPDGTPEHIKDDLEDNLTAINEISFFSGQDADWVLPYLARKRTTFDEWCAKTDLSGYAA
ncbi:uncharacterized protein RHOBADRAFT_65887 [Rhodotorula graminis WP1]|uniref:NmrA-like domain-containing protein n=1 Tax=Rhodotorula graminis (strain WP1) TaxID=578459 RepID=A0A194SC03_RHOGW|nr:uncharacterized protein RHOBADRAFT_65887 [Rhodotorula graminis WP1]KPV78263.1 hypothetical protein RHOBADRAFT_65887 [Rhodotorula graminis WP1]